MKNNLLSELKYIDNLIERLMDSLKKSPEGILNAGKGNGVFQYYLKSTTEERSGKYLRKRDIMLAQSLAQRDYEEELLECALNIKKNIVKNLDTGFYIELSEIYQLLSDVFMKQNEARQALISPVVTTCDMYTKTWLDVEYQGKEFAKDYPEYYTERGERVRSKSEKMIADKLLLMGIPYRYEYPLKIKGFGTIYPDFTLLNARKRTTVLYEHFGRMQDEEYCIKTLSKIETYEKNGYHLGSNFICTFESIDHPLDMRHVVRTVKAALDK